MARKNEVTQIKVNVKRPNRRSIFLDGEFAFSVAEGIFHEHDIKVGDVLTDEEIDELVSLDDREKAKSDALNLLSYRQRSVEEMRTRLLKKGWNPALVTSLIAELEEKGFLNDREFAEMVARDRTERKLIGPRMLRTELAKKGVVGEIIADVVENAYRRHPPQALIDKLLRSRGIEPGVPVTREQKEKLVNFLRRKGFTWDEMESAISRLKTD